MASTLNSASAGTDSPTRIKPRSRSNRYALRRASTVETSARGEMEPSLIRKSGSRPSLVSKRARAPPIEHGVTPEADGRLLTVVDQPDQDEDRRRDAEEPRKDVWHSCSPPPAGSNCKWVAISRASRIP